MARTTSPDSRRAVAAWLFACCALVFVMVVVGGVTRLTHSGLSIVEWQPVIGAVPPLDDAQWNVEFDKYKLSPEYRQRNFDMTLDGFKGIFWWEYSHRLLGRLIGAAFLLPFIYFLARGVVRGALAWRLAGNLCPGRHARGRRMADGGEWPRGRSAREFGAPGGAPGHRVPYLRRNDVGRAGPRHAAHAACAGGAGTSRPRLCGAGSS